MRRNFTLIVLAVVCAISIGLYFILTSGRTAAQIGYLYQLMPDEVLTEIVLENNHGTFEFRYDGNQWKVIHNGYYRAHEEKMRLMLLPLKAFPIERELDVDVILPEFGLDSPIKITLRTSAGRNFGFDVGDVSVTRATAYVRDHRDGRIYMTSISHIAHFDGSIAAYRCKEIFTINRQDIRKITYYQNNQMIVDVYRNPDNDWVLLYPVEVPARNIYMNELVSSMRRWIIAEFPEEGREGVFNGDVLVLYDGYGNSQKLYIGSQVGARTYVRTEADDVVLMHTLSIDALDVLNPSSIMFVAPLLTTIEQVRSISVTIPNQTFELLVEGDRYYLQNNEISASDFTRVFVRYISILAEGYSPNDTNLPRNQFVASFETVFHDGSKTELSLYQRDEYTYWMDFGEDVVFYKSQEAFEKLLNLLLVLS